MLAVTIKINEGRNLKTQIVFLESLSSHEKIWLQIFSRFLIDGRIRRDIGFSKIAFFKSFPFLAVSDGSLKSLSFAGKVVVL